MTDLITSIDDERVALDRKYSFADIGVLRASLRASLEREKADKAALCKLEAQLSSTRAELHQGFRTNSTLQNEIDETNAELCRIGELLEEKELDSLRARVKELEEALIGARRELLDTKLDRALVIIHDAVIIPELRRRLGKETPND